MEAKRVFKIMGLPEVTSWEETAIKPTALKHAQLVIKKAPEVGQLVISGVSSPALQELYEQGRKVASVDYFEFFTAKFSEEQVELPPSRKGQVTLIYGVGKEPVKNFEYSSKILQGLINKYSAKGLVVVETHLTPSTFNLQYGVQFANRLIIPPQKEQVWA